MMSDKKERVTGEYELKKILKKLESFRGRNTELVSLYVPAGYNLNEIVNFLTSERSESENIKSKQTRKNVQAALDKIQRRLKEVGKTPENGVALFCGNISEQEGRPDIQMWEVVPPQSIESRIYRCDKEFVLEPLKEMFIEKNIFGLVVADRKNAAVGTLKGKNLRVLNELESNVPGKHTKGGQCLHPDTRIILDTGESKKIGELDKDSISLFSCDFEDFGSESSNSEKVFSSKHSHFYRIKTTNPTEEIKATGQHKFFVLGEEGFEEKFVEDLEEGDYLLLVKNLDFPGEAQSLNIEPSIKYVPGVKGRELLKEAREEANFTQKELGEELGVGQSTIYKFENNKANLGQEKLLKLIDTLNIDKEEVIRDYCQEKAKYSVPEEINYKLARFLGYVLGDGVKDGNRVRMFEEREDVAEEYRDLISDLFGLDPSIIFREDKNYYKIIVYQKELSEKLLREFSEIFEGAKESKIPRKIHKLPEDVLAGFIRGLYDAEGWISHNCLGIAMANKEVIHSLQSLLLRFEIYAARTEYKDSKGRKKYALKITNIEFLRKYKENIGLTAEDKSEKLKKATRNRENHRSRTNQVPLNGKQVWKYAKELNLIREDFQDSWYFLDERKKSFKNFNETILPVFERRKKELEELSLDSLRSFRENLGVKLKDIARDISKSNNLVSEVERGLEEDSETEESLRKELKKEKDRLITSSKEIIDELNKFNASDFIIANIKSIDKTEIGKRMKFYDIDVPEYRNFIANNFVVHNSQHRYERVIEERYKSFLKDIAEKAELNFLEKARKGELNGLIIGGPGFAKEDLIEKGYLHNELKDKVIAQKGTNYSGEEGLYELLNKVQDTIEKEEVVKEKKLVNKFLENLKKENGKSVYGMRETAKALKIGAVDILLISESIDTFKVKYKCFDCDSEEVEYEKSDEIPETIECPECGSDMVIEEDRDIVEVFGEKADQMDSNLEIISTETPEGERLRQMGGIAAILRYRIS